MSQSTIQLKGINQSFFLGKPQQKDVLHDIDLKINPEDFIVIVGGNGAGKSTLQQIISGSLQPTSGQILKDDKVVTKESVQKRAEWIGRVFQDPKEGTAGRLTIAENLALAAKRGQKRHLTKANTKEKDFVRLLKTLDLGLEQRLTTDVNFLSGGQRQALTLLMATLVKPELLLLDEHTAALDPKTSEMVLAITDKIIKENRLTALMITHNLTDALKYGNRLVMLQSGRITLDLDRNEKEKLTVTDLMAQFNEPVVV